MVICEWEPAAAAAAAAAMKLKRRDPTTHHHQYNTILESHNEKNNAAKKGIMEFLSTATLQKKSGSSSSSSKWSIKWTMAALLLVIFGVIRVGYSNEGLVAMTRTSRSNSSSRNQSSSSLRSSSTASSSVAKTSSSSSSAAAADILLAPPIIVQEKAAAIHTTTTTSSSSSSSLAFPNNNNNNIGPYTSQQIIVMGLPKTGTTSTAQALQALGYHVSHNQGDTLPVTNNGKTNSKNSQSCNVIANTHELQYRTLHQRHPTATWIVTYSENVTAWIDSFAYHFSFHQKHYSLTKLKRAHQQFGLSRKDNKNKENGGDNDDEFQTLVKQDYPAGREHDATAGYEFMLRHADFYERFYQKYYDDLFAFLHENIVMTETHQQSTIPIVDVRAGSGYETLAAVTLNGTQPVNPHLPFPHVNTKDHKGGWPRCS